MNRARERKLIYIMNKVDPGDSQHFVPVLRGLNSLKKLGWDVIVLSEKGGEGETEIFGCRVVYLSNSSRCKRVMNLFRQLRLLRREGFRLILVRISLPAAIAAAISTTLNRQALLFWVSGTVLDFNREKNPGKHHLRMLALRTVLHRARFLLTGPERMVTYYRDELRIPRDKVRLLYNDVDLDTFRSEVPERPAHCLRLLILHRLSPVRETHRYLPAILDSMSELWSLGHPTELRLVGEGPEHSVLTKICSEHPMGEHVHFAGGVANSQTPDFYREADIFLLPSFREGFPRVLIEAMACGLPVVSTDAGGIRDIVGANQQQFVSERSDAAAFGRNLVRLVLSPDTRTRLREENTHEASRFGVDEVAVMLQEILDDVLSSLAKR